MICRCVNHLLTLKYIPMIQHYGLPITPSIIFSTICKTVQTMPADGSRQIKWYLTQRSQPTLDLYLNGNLVEEAKDEKLLANRRDNHLAWHSHIEYLIGKLNSRIYLLKRAKDYLNLHCEKLLFNVLVKPLNTVARLG